ncbi:MAG: hypothetical protein IJ326_02545 [Lachnospiraceae bacterium]|nr:hypothetical protein [Lachnospiraceae bacterium]
MLQLEKPMVDERIQKETNRFFAKLFFFQTLFVIGGMVMQIVNPVPLRVFCLQIICLVVGIGFALIQLITKGVFWLKAKDDALISIREEILAVAYSLEFIILLLGDCVFIFFEKEYSSWNVLYCFEWMIPAWIYVVIGIKHSWIQWGGKARQINGKKLLKKLWIPAMVAAVFMIILLELPDWLEDKVFSGNEIFAVSVIVIGIPMGSYFLMKKIVDAGEKRANKMLEELEKQEEMTLEE